MMDEHAFKKIVNGRKKTFHIVNEQGRYILRKETGERLFGSFYDYKENIIFFEGPIAARDKVLHLVFTTSDWAIRGNVLEVCDCDVERCEGRLAIKLYMVQPTDDWTLAVEE
jgi:hypothetical protein